MFRLEKVIATRLERQRRGRQQKRGQRRKDGRQTGKTSGRGCNDVDVHAGNVAPTDSRPLTSGAAGKEIGGSQPTSDPVWPVTTEPTPVENFTTTDEHTASVKATVTTESVLERVRIIRVFDFIGLEEAVAEIGDELGRQAGVSSGPGSDDGARSQTEMPEKPRRSEFNAEESENKKNIKRKEVIVDSEDEDDEGGEDSDEMLLRPADRNKTDENPADEMTMKVERQVKGRDQRGLMIIDSFTHVVNPLLKRNFVHGMWRSGPRSFLKMI